MFIKLEFYGWVDEWMDVNPENVTYTVSWSRFEGDAPQISLSTGVS
jgi:hypothetical protein